MGYYRHYQCDKKGEGEREAAWLGVWELYLVFSWLVTVAKRAVCCTRDLSHSFTVQHTLSVAQLGGYCMCLDMLSGQPASITKNI